MANLGVEPEATKTQILTSPEQRGQEKREKEVRGHSSRLLIVDHDSRGGSSTVSEMVPDPVGPALQSRGYQVHSVDSDGAALESLSRTSPALLILAVSDDASTGSGRPVAELRAEAQRLGIPVLEVLDSGAGLGLAFEPSPEADDWVLRGACADELAARVARLLRRSRTPGSATGNRSSGVPVDTRFTSLVVHDLRTPLNVIGLSFRMIEQVLPRDDPDVAEDVRFIEENFRQLERMLSQLGDYSRLSEPGLNLSVSEFSPRRLVEELLENREARPGGKKPRVQLDFQKTCPEEVALDQGAPGWRSITRWQTPARPLTMSRSDSRFEAGRSAGSSRWRSIVHRPRLSSQSTSALIRTSGSAALPRNGGAWTWRSPRGSASCSAARRGSRPSRGKALPLSSTGRPGLPLAAWKPDAAQPEEPTAGRSCLLSLALGMRVAIGSIMLMAVESSSPASVRVCDRFHGTL